MKLITPARLLLQATASEITRHSSVVRLAFYLPRCIESLIFLRVDLTLAWVVLFVLNEGMVVVLYESVGLKEFICIFCMFCCILRKLMRS